MREWEYPPSTAQASRLLAERQNRIPPSSPSFRFVVRSAECVPWKMSSEIVLWGASVECVDGAMFCVARVNEPAREKRRQEEPGSDNLSVS